MMLRRLHTLLAFTLSLMVLLGCGGMNPATPTAEESSDFVFSPLENAEEVQRAVSEATSHPNAILLVHVDWAPMVLQQERFAEFKRAYKTKYPQSDLLFAYIDCTAITDDYAPLRSLPGWKKLQDQQGGSSLVHGNGELVWCKNGVVLNVENPFAFESTDALILKTESLGMVRTAK